MLSIGVMNSTKTCLQVLLVSGPTSAEPCNHRLLRDLLAGAVQVRGFVHLIAVHYFATV